LCNSVYDQRATVDPVRGSFNIIIKQL